jgi:hypothetical protein
VIRRLLQLVKSFPQLGQLKDAELANYRLSDSRLKYDLLSQANAEFEHTVPNSMLYLIETVGKKYFKGTLDVYCSTLLA